MTSAVQDRPHLTYPRALTPHGLACNAHGLSPLLLYGWQAVSKLQTPQIFVSQQMALLSVLLPCSPFPGHQPTRPFSSPCTPSPLALKLVKGASPAYAPFQKRGKLLPCWAEVGAGGTNRGMWWHDGGILLQSAALRFAPQGHGASLPQTAKARSARGNL